VPICSPIGVAMSDVFGGPAAGLGGLSDEDARMLSIGKLAAGHADYYLEQARGPVTRATAVSSGVEDYYVGGPEAAGEWAGGGSALLALRGTVDADSLHRVLAGEHPRSGLALGRHAATRVPGFDLTFSAPKSVSLLFGICDDRLRRVIRVAHDRAVADALAYMERQTAVTRRGAGGMHSIPGRGLVAAAFRHRTSRAGDPQLHTHVLVANLTLGADGRWSALDGRRLYAHAKTAGYLYEARLRAELTEQLGVEWGPVRNGIADIAGVPAAVLRAFSRRRAEIDAELARHGTRSAAAAQVAALETRRRKDYRVRPEQLVPEWRERAANLGLTPERVHEHLGHCVPRQLDPDLEERVAARLAAADGLTHRRSTFTRRDVIQALCAELPAGTAITVAEAEDVADRFLSSERAVVLAAGERVGTLLRRDGTVVPLVRDERVYSTPELLTLERRILEHAAGTRQAQLAVVRPAVIERALARRPTIAGEQAAMVRRLTGEGAGVAVVVGQAGTGKTFALAAAREAWEASGHVVIGAALARRAARELEDGAGIPGSSVAALLEQLRARPYRALPRRAVVVIDEAGMVATRQLAELVEHAARRHAKLVLVCDHRQLSEIEAGGAFRALAARLPVIELNENRRQVARWERDALALLRDGDHHTALQRYEERGRVMTGETMEDVRRQVVADWWAVRDPERAVMIAFRRADVADLNGHARALMRATGALGPGELMLPGGAFAVGDHVVLRRNDRRLRVANGERGVVAAVDPAAAAIEVRVGDRRVRLDGDYLERGGGRGGPALAHGYAITGHSAQGLTCDRAFVLVTSEASREWCYTALSRGRHENRLYAVAREPEEREEFAPAGEGRDALADALGRSTAQTLASDVDRRRALAEQLRLAMDEAAAARRAHDQAVDARRELERRVPHPLRVRARGRHVEELAGAAQVVADAAERVDAADARVAALTNRMTKERPPRERARRDRLLAERARAVNDLGIDR
jgi:conjugative relaxase-like TrwC/TraI family protein